jgi:hypothetical protein
MRSAGLMVFVSMTACLEPMLPLPEDAQDAGHDAGVFICSPRTCTGCCEGNRCLGGNLDEACGHTGRACQRCEASLRCETPGACFPRPGRDAGIPRPVSDAGLSILDSAALRRKCFVSNGALVCF